jgi:L-glyceraldehyde 3-phosphate reductase
MFDRWLEKRGQTISQLAISWILRHPEITSVLIGASHVNQIKENLESLDSKTLPDEDLEKIDEILQSEE